MTETTYEQHIKSDEYSEMKTTSHILTQIISLLGKVLAHSKTCTCINQISFFFFSFFFTNFKWQLVSSQHMHPKLQENPD